MKKNWLIVLIVVAVVSLAVGGFLVLRKGPSSTGELEAEGLLLETSLEERPLTMLIPRDDGKEFNLEISRIKNAETVEYELVYLTQGLSRGAIGSVNLRGKTSLERKLLLGTCSRGVCKYDEDVSEGTLTLRFRSPEGVRKFISDFHLQQGDKQLVSPDGNFQLEGSFSASAFYLTMNTVGLPGNFDGQVVAGPYGVFTAGSKVVKNGRVSLTLAEENAEAKLYFWSGSGWQELIDDFKADGKTLSAAVDSLGVFIAATSE